MPPRPRSLTVSKRPMRSSSSIDEAGGAGLRTRPGASRRRAGTREQWRRRELPLPAIVCRLRPAGAAVRAGAGGGPNARDAAQGRALRAQGTGPQPRLCCGRHPLARPRGRRQHRDVLAGGRGAVASDSGHAIRPRSSTSSPAAATATNTPRRRIPTCSDLKAQNTRLQRHDRVHADVCAARPRRPLASRAGAGGDVEPLHTCWVSRR